MSTKRLTRPMVERTLWIVNESGILDILAPPIPVGQRGRKGRIRENIRLWIVGVILCTRLGHETTLKGVHDVLTQALPREMQWELGILRPLTTSNSTKRAAHDPEAARMTRNGKPRKEIWPDEGYERLGYDDLVNAVAKIRARLDYGHGSAPDLHPAERAARRTQVEDAVDSLITVTVVPRTCSTVAIDATGQWSWNIGPKKEQRAAQKRLSAGTNHAPSEDVETSLQVTEILADDDTDAPATPGTLTTVLRRCLDAAWGYKTGKDGQKEVGYGFHQHTVVRTADPNSTGRPEPLLVEGLVVVPANEDVVEASLRLLDRVQHRSRITRVAGDLLYTNLKADRWAVPLAQRGIEQILAMREDGGGCVDINGAVMQYGWMHCPAAPMDQRPLPASFARDEDDDHYDAVDEFKANWAFDRKESGLGRNPSSKWICPAVAGRTGCWARGNDNVTVAGEAGLPIITPPEDWRTRPCCTNKTMDFTPDPTNPHHQRKLMQREYVGTRRWRRAFNLRSSVEGAFGILKNPSRQRMRRGQNRLPGLAMANLINGLKAAVFNEEQLRSWHEDTGLGPVDHPLLQPDPHDWGFTDLTEDQAKAMDARYLIAAPAGLDTVGEDAA